MESILFASFYERCSSHTLRRGGWRQRDAQSSSEGDFDAGTDKAPGPRIVAEVLRRLAFCEPVVHGFTECGCRWCGMQTCANAGQVRWHQKCQRASCYAAGEATSPGNHQRNRRVADNTLHQAHRSGSLHRAKLPPGIQSTIWGARWHRRILLENAFPLREAPSLGGGAPPLAGSFAIPVAIHQDAGPCSKSKSAGCIRFSSLLAESNETTAKFLLATRVADKGSGTIIWGEILKNLESAVTSHFGGFSCVLLSARAGEEQRCIKWGLPR